MGGGENNFEKHDETTNVWKFTQAQMFNSVLNLCDSTILLHFKRLTYYYEDTDLRGLVIIYALYLSK